jgi:DNA mismatch repair protein MSH6
MELGSDDDDGNPRGKTQTKKPKLSPKGVTGVTSTSSGASFLTAAEQREQDKKNEKKAAEDPYAFLSVIKDVGHEPLTNLLPSNVFS